MHINGFPYNIANRHTGIKTCVRILKHDLHFFAVRKHIRINLLIHIEDHIIVIDKTTACGLIQPKQCTSRSSLAATGFSHQSQRFSSVNGKGNIINCLNIFLSFAVTAGREILL